MPRRTASAALKGRERTRFLECLLLLLSLAPLCHKSAQAEAFLEPCISSPLMVQAPILVSCLTHILIIEPLLRLTHFVAAIVDPTGTGAFASGTKADVTQQVPGVFGEIAPSGQRRWISKMLVKMGLMKRAQNVNQDYVC